MSKRSRDVWSFGVWGVRKGGTAAANFSKFGPLNHVFDEFRQSPIVHVPRFNRLLAGLLQSRIRKCCRTRLCWSEWPCMSNLRPENRVGNIASSGEGVETRKWQRRANQWGYGHKLFLFPLSIAPNSKEATKSTNKSVDCRMNDTNAQFNNWSINRPSA